MQFKLYSEQMRVEFKCDKDIYELDFNSPCKINDVKINGDDNDYGDVNFFIVKTVIDSENVNEIYYLDDNGNKRYIIVEYLDEQ